jgi:hypothetical protein
MDAIIFLLVGIIIGGATAFLITHFTEKKDCANDDPTGEKKEKIFSDLMKLKKDIETTV